jgi:hypothetical protein
MMTMGIKPGDAVLVIERRGEQQLVYNALVAGLSMDDRLAGVHGEPAIRACFVALRAKAGYVPDWPLATMPDVVHISHVDFIEGRAGLGYEELQGAVPGMCRFCKCTEQRACPGPCRWLDAERTVCSNLECAAKLLRERGLAWV